MNNIKQLTEQDIPETKDEYYNFVLSDPNSNRAVIKIGYVCEPKGIGEKIKITTSDRAENWIQIGKTGIYEGQTESYWLFGGDEEKTANIKIKEVSVPVGIKFTLDYVLS